MNLLRLLSWHTDVELQDDDEEETEEDDLPAVEWTRHRVPSDQERQAYDEGLRRHVEHLSAVVDPFRPRLQPRLSKATPETAPVWTKDPPSTPGTWWVRVPGHQRKVVEVYRRNGELWLRWSDVPAAKVPRTGLEWGSRPIVSPVEPR